MSNKLSVLVIVVASFAAGFALRGVFAPVATLQAAWDAGIRHFDTAPLYGFGLSEHRFGQVLRQQPRDSFTLSTKVGRMLAPDAGAAADRDNFHGGLPFRARFDYSADATRRSIEDSLQRLGMARIDAEIHRDLERLVKLGARPRLDERDTQHSRQLAAVADTELAISALEVVLHGPDGDD